MNKKILLIVEGKKTEPVLFKRIEEVLNEKLQSKFEICPFGTNIYSLYKQILKYDFNVNIKDLLAEIHPEYKEKLKNNFLYTYLIFDFDPHHSKKNDTRSIKEIALENAKKVGEMAKYFTNETDPTIGKLYVNYPTIESYKDCNSFFDNDYKNEKVALSDIKHYKEMVSKKIVAMKRVDSYTSGDFEKLIIQNIFKLNYLLNSKWEMIEYKEYLNYSNNLNVLNAQKELIDFLKEIAVLNTSLFLIVDYFGNKNNYYSNLINNAKVLLIE